jgi:hypothetical protein
MTKKNWKTVFYIGWAIFAVGIIWSLVIHFQHWEEIMSYKQKFMYQLPATCVLVPGWLIATLGMFKK